MSTADVKITYSPHRINSTAAPSESEQQDNAAGRGSEVETPALLWAPVPAAPLGEVDADCYMPGECGHVPSEAPTPETDALINDDTDWMERDQSCVGELLVLARKLERQRDAALSRERLANAERDELHGHVQKLVRGLKEATEREREANDLRETWERHAADCQESERLANMRAEQFKSELIKLSKAVDAAQSAIGWIACSERLPLDNTQVIVEGGIGYIRKGVWMTVTAFDWPGKPIQWEVTHWMPLPAAPVASSSEREEQE